MIQIQSNQSLRRVGFAAAALGMSALLAACGSPKPTVGVAAAAPTKIVNGVLTGLNGKTLYTFDRDVVDSGKSACAGDCAVAWPPLVATTDAGRDDYTVITRADNVKQWAYRGKPLYFFTRDSAAGDILGEGVMNAWHVARP